MSSAAKPRTSIKLQGHRKRKYAEALLELHQSNDGSLARTLITPQTSAVRIVCISDTHNKRPTIPLGDVLIHAGDLTEHGSFDELQDGLNWLSSQPHKHKIFIAGNHDVLLDDAFLEKYPERRYEQTKTKHDLAWGSVVYLQDSTITLEIPTRKPSGEDVTDAACRASAKTRSLTIFGSPWTPQYGISAFQYPRNNVDHWKRIFAKLDETPHIVITHGPPHLHLDKRDFHRAGCPYLAEEIHRLKPLLHIFGHIHASYGRESVLLDHVQKLYEEIMRDWAGWGSVFWMAVLVLWAKMRRIFRCISKHKRTTLINASVVGGPDNALQNEPIIVEL